MQFGICVCFLHYVSKGMSCHKAILVIPGRAIFFIITYILSPCYFWEIWPLCATKITFDHLLIRIYGYMNKVYKYSMYIYIYIYIYIVRVKIAYRLYWVQCSIKIIMIKILKMPTVIIVIITIMALFFVFFIYITLFFFCFYLFISEKNVNQCIYNSFLYSKVKWE